MPHAPASGKARAGRGSHAVALEHFPQSGMVSKPCRRAGVLKTSVMDTGMRYTRGDRNAGRSEAIRSAGKTSPHADPGGLQTPPEYATM
jgi:hypothetical protein